MPFFSVIIPSYNRAALLPRAIQSVIHQTFDDWELLVVDDGSTDDTAQQVAVFNDPRIRYLYQNNQGVCVARNTGAHHAKGEYLVFLDSDDYATSNWLHDFDHLLKTHAVDLVFCDMKRVNLTDDSYKIVRALYPFRDTEYTQAGFFMSGTFAVTVAFFSEIGGFDPVLRYSEFTEFGFRCQAKGFNRMFTEKVGLVYEASLDGGSKNMKNKIESIQYIMIKHNNLFDTNFREKRKYLQILAVSYARVKDWKSSQIYFLKAFKVQFWHLKTILQLIISFFPAIGSKFWK